jgi:succinyl-CoA synthetase beta subunit
VAKTPGRRARAAAAEIAGPVVLKSQVLTGGRMKAGGVKFADDAGRGRGRRRRRSSRSRSRARSRAGCWSSSARRSRRSTSRAVTWDGRRKLPVVVFSDMGGIDIEEVAEKHPEHVSRTHLSTLLPFSPHRAKEAVAAVGCER